MKNKKTLLAIIIAVAVLAIAAVVFAIKPWDDNKDESSSVADSSSVIDSSVPDDSSSDVDSSVPDDSSDITDTPAKALTPVDYYGEMKVVDGKIVGSKTNEQVRVTGMSFFWSNWSQKYYTKKYVDLMVDDFGCEVLRCSYGINDEEGVPYDTSCERLIENVIEQAIERGIYVIVDWHSHQAHTSPDEAVRYFGELAQKYGEYDNVIFEIYNEPTKITWKAVKEYAETVIPEIRKYSDNLIIVGSPDWSQKVTQAADNPIDDENVAYTLHFYAGTHQKWLRDTADGAMKNGIALFVTEWGSVNADGNGAISKQSTEEWFEWMDENGISSCNWAINDKEEGSSIFVKDSADELTETGIYIRDLIKQRTQNSPWRNAG